MLVVKKRAGRTDTYQRRLDCCKSLGDQINEIDRRLAKN